MTYRTEVAKWQHCCEFQPNVVKIRQNAFWQNALRPTVAFRVDHGMETDGPATPKSRPRSRCFLHFSKQERICEFTLSVWSPPLKCTGATMDRSRDALTRRARCGQAIKVVNKYKLILPFIYPVFAVEDTVTFVQCPIYVATKCPPLLGCSLIRVWNLFKKWPLGIRPELSGRIATTMSMPIHARCAPYTCTKETGFSNKGSSALSTCAPCLEKVCVEILSFCCEI